MLVPDTTACSLRDRTTRYAYDVRPLQNFGVEIIEVGGGDDGLGAHQEILCQVLAAALVELAHHVVEEQDRVLPRLRQQVVLGRELERERRQALLTLRTVGGQAHPAEQDLEVVPVRTDRGGASFDVGAVRLSERLSVPVQGSAIGIADRGLLGAVESP